MTARRKNKASGRPIIMLATVLVIAAVAIGLVANFADQAAGRGYYRQPSSGRLGSNGGTPTPGPVTMTSSIDALIKNRPAPQANDFKVFSSYSATGCATDLKATWNRNSWGAPINLSPVAWHDDAGWGNPWVCGPTLGQGVAVTKRHVLTHDQHGVEIPGSTLQFVRRNGEIKTIKTATEYEVAGPFRILWLEEDLPDDMVAALPTKDSQILNRPVAVITGSREIRLQHVIVEGPPNIVVREYELSPARWPYGGGGRPGDSGKPIFAVMDREMVPVSIWFGSYVGNSIIPRSDDILAAINRLTVTKRGTARGGPVPRLINVQ
jgi:hypothetical protein